MPLSEETNEKQNKGFNRLKRKRTTNLVKSRTITSVLVVASVVVIALIIILVFFRVKEIKIEGNTSYSKQDIIDDCGIEIGDNLYLLKDSEISEAITSKYPLVRKVTIKRNIPTTIVLELKCDDPSFYVTIDGEYFLCTQSLRIVAHETDPQTLKEKFPGAKQLICADIEQAILGSQIVFVNDNYIKDVSEFINVLTSNEIFDGVTTLDISDRFHISLVYDHTKKVDIGDTTDDDLKLRFAYEIIKDLGAQSATVNVEDVETGYAIPSEEQTFD